MNTEEKYLALMQEVLNEGIYVENSRTNSECLTLINKSMQYGSEFPLLTTRKMYWKQAICEMLCYMRGYTKLEEFHLLGVHSWDANALAWEHPNNPHKTNVGFIYGASSTLVGLTYPRLIENIKANPTDRGHIWNFWNPEYFNEGCLRPCMMLHQFNVLGNKLYLTSYQRSVDLPLGYSWNLVQTWFLLNVTARLTGYVPANILHTMSNVHIYKNQEELVEEHLKREPYDPPTFIFKKDITLEDIMYNINKDNFDEYFGLENYQYHPPIKYPFTV